MLPMPAPAIVARIIPAFKAGAGVGEFVVYPPNGKTRASSLKPFVRQWAYPVIAGHIDID